MLAGRPSVKRAFDVALSAVGLVVLAPVILVVAIAVRLFVGKPVLFRQERPGLHGEIFTLVKFRTMSNQTDAAGNLLPDADRLTKLGRVLRSSSLDELPTLWCVLTGSMSLVGPRPLLPAYLDRYSPHHARRHEVRPGITGLAQVSGRNAITWEERLDLDVKYVDEHSMRLDLMILAKTARAVVNRTGISADDHPTMPEYQGPTEVAPAHPQVSHRPQRR
jgi:lipopolysaccharide/colanic/teichoic acid biosynthesis glycosyltransferase